MRPPNEKSLGKMPMIVAGRPSTDTLRPTASAAPSKRRCHTLYEIRMTSPRPGCSASRPNVRPAAGMTPKSGKKSDGTRSAGTRSGASPSRTDKAGMSTTAACSNSGLLRAHWSVLPFRDDGSLETGHSPGFAHGKQPLSVGERQRPKQHGITALNIAVVAPTPRASAVSAAVVKPRLLMESDDRRAGR